MCIREKESDSKEKDMSQDYEHQMWEHMMDCCCLDMSDEEKQKKMKDMKKKMHHIKSHMGPMMETMHHRMGRMHDKGPYFMPMDMCKEMMSSIKESHRVATLATPEVQGLFEDWVEQIEQEMLDHLKDKDSVDISEITKHFKISKDSAYYFLTKLAQKGKLKINVSKAEVDAENKK
jgi:hypothetical protein